MAAGNVFLKLNDAEAVALVKLTNYGDCDVNNISYTLYYTDSGQSDAPKTLTFETPLACGETRQVSIPIMPSSVLGKTILWFNVTNVNGSYNEATVGYTSITRCTVNKKPHKRVLVEDYTAMWCWHCPVGMVATDALARKYPDDVVAVSIHKGDGISKVVSPNVYEGLIDTYAAKLPSVWMARKGKVGGLDGTSMYESEKCELTYMNIDVKAQWDETGNNISVTSEVEPCMTPEDGNTYAVGYVLTASGLTNDSWLQQASYSEYASEAYDDAPEEMDIYRDPANYVQGYYYVKGVAYNHVAIESQGMYNGIANSLPGGFADNKMKTHTTTFNNVGKYDVIGDRSKFKIVAVLFNTTTNKVENVAQCDIQTPKQTFSLTFGQSDWTTLYTDRSYTVPMGVATYCVNAQGRVIQVSDGTVDTVTIAADTPMLLKAKKGETYTFEYSEATGIAVETCLRGSLVDELTATGNTALGDNDVYYYKLGEDKAQANVGFYWGADDGGAFTNQAGNCYLVLRRDNIGVGRKEGFALDSDGDDPDGVKQTSESEESRISAIFDMQGRKVNTMTAPGFYIVNGKKVMVK